MERAQSGAYGSLQPAHEAATTWQRHANDTDTLITPSKMRKAGACLGRARNGVPLVRALMGTVGPERDTPGPAMRPLGNHMSESASGPVIISPAT